MSRMVTCPTCDGEGVIEGSTPLHHLHSEYPDYGTEDCPDCEGTCEQEVYTDDDVEQELQA